LISPRKKMFEKEAHVQASPMKKKKRKRIRQDGRGGEFEAKGGKCLPRKGKKMSPRVPNPGFVVTGGGKRSNQRNAQEKTCPIGGVLMGEGAKEKKEKKRGPLSGKKRTLWKEGDRAP